jgi:hypothetical protein
MSDLQTDPYEMEFWETALPSCGLPGLPSPFGAASAPLHDVFGFSTGATPPCCDAGLR